MFEVLRQPHLLGVEGGLQVSSSFQRQPGCCLLGWEAEGRSGGCSNGDKYGVGGYAIDDVLSTVIGPAFSRVKGPGTWEYGKWGGEGCREGSGDTSVAYAVEIYKYKTECDYTPGTRNKKDRYALHEIHLSHCKKKNPHRRWGPSARGGIYCFRSCRGKRSQDDETNTFRRKQTTKTSPSIIDLSNTMFRCKPHDDNASSL